MRLLVRPVTGGKTAAEHHLIVEAHRIPVSAITTGGNRLRWEIRYDIHPYVTPD
ncbi:hypothetical protein ABZS61_09095 [Streptomyces sp. NPDC005566]|uniref:hypothetical protein n=1 Tax=Streptomyces sp. NPDC005566 TaxID=3156886 RepID=UPI0033B25EE6